MGRGFRSNPDPTRRQCLLHADREGKEREKEMIASMSVAMHHPALRVRETPRAPNGSRVPTRLDRLSSQPISHSSLSSIVKAKGLRSYISSSSSLEPRRSPVMLWLIRWSVVAVGKSFELEQQAELWA